MKKYYFTVLVVLSVLFFSCTDSAQIENTPFLTIKNESSSVLSEVIWNSVLFSDDMGKGHFVKKEVIGDGNGFIYFKKGTMLLRTQELILCDSQQKTFTFTNNTLVVEIADASNVNTLNGIAPAILTIKNESSLTISNVSWNNMSFPENLVSGNFFEMEVTKDVKGYIFIKKNNMLLRTQSEIGIDTQRESFTFTDNTIVVELTNIENINTLHEITPTMLKIINESSYTLLDIQFAGIDFFDSKTNSKELPVGGWAEQVVPLGHEGSVFFTIKQKDLFCRTMSTVVVESQSVILSIKDTTDVRETYNSLNTGSISNIIKTFEGGTYTASGQVTLIPGATYEIYLIGGGGGGQGSNYKKVTNLTGNHRTWGTGSGGGGGATIFCTYTPTENTIIEFTIGKGGSGGARDGNYSGGGFSGTNGSDTTIKLKNTTLSGGGGKGGGSSGGYGGVAFSSGDLTIFSKFEQENGERGFLGDAHNGSMVVYGGNSGKVITGSIQVGGTGAGYNRNANNNAMDSGGGGAGGAESASPTKSGGKGFDGKVIIKRVL